MRPLLAVVFAFAALAGPAAAEVALGVRPDWAGVARPGQWTGLRVSAEAERGGSWVFRVGDGSPSVTFTARLEAGAPRVLRIPAWVPPSGRVEVSGIMGQLGAGL